MPKKTQWDEDALETITPIKKFLSSSAINVRTDQYNFFKKHFRPNAKTKILDVGVAAEEVLPDVNMFEKLYRHRNKLTLATIEDARKLKKIYPKTKTVKIFQHKKLPFKDKEFDVAVSWATLEHVGNYKQQKEFIDELSRVSKRYYLTTPYRWCVYEPHTGLPFVQWLPLNIFRKICKMTGRDFWATEQNLNPLFVRDVKKMYPKAKVKIYKMFGFLPSHLIIYFD